MKEQLQVMPKSEIKWPQQNKIEVSSDVDFIYIMRKDGTFAMSPVAQKLSSDYGLGENLANKTLLEEYDTFFANLADIFQWGYSSKGNFELHLYDADILDKAVRKKSEEMPIISLDPLMYQGVYEHRVSRGYHLGGIKDFGQVARPGSEPLHIQAQKVATHLSQKSAVVVEDDIFSGGSVVTSLQELMDHRVKINKVIPGIQIGKPKELIEMGMQVDPVVCYETNDGTNIFDKVDLGDPRDYLLGASGLVVKLPNGEFGRAPYILPFVSTAARAGIPKVIEKDFSLKALEANFTFFTNVEDKTGKPILLQHMDYYFIRMMYKLHGLNQRSLMRNVVTWSLEHIDDVWNVHQELGLLQESKGGNDV